jgi:peroxiredoxin
LPEHNRQLVEQRHLTFPILSDHGNEVAAAFGLRFALPDYLRDIYRSFPLDLATFNGDASWTLPMPARFVVDRHGVIRSAESDPDYTTRPEPSDTLEALRRVAREG